ncbi:DUF695 domain-containing protein [Myxococcus stipitatus]|uniref:DUF695 domain-containing protein n=1 Tax=Myxococcus stipitatus TaxID=83455 RepID=UPI001F4822EE|nr:DUF695 domain-containing protein [Myxococcus stipitatus]MCE9667166.1 DUF695 domain-containing protein [Myxococcus stipitatus]
MARTWTSQVDTYMAQTTEGPVSMYLDMGAARVAPLASHPVGVIVVIPMKAPRPDGLRAREECQPLFALEDALEQALAPLDLIFVGHAVGQGTTDLYFYGPESTSEAAVVDVVRGAQGSYFATVRLTRDPEWRAYRDWLYPDGHSQHFMANRQLLAFMKKNGDLHDVPRTIDHRCEFQSAHAAEQAARALASRGFAVEPPCPHDKPHAPWRLDFTRKDRLDDGQADAVTAEILELVEPHGGTYDGWGCEVQTRRPWF